MLHFGYHVFARSILYGLLLSVEAGVRLKFGGGDWPYTILFIEPVFWLGPMIYYMARVGHVARERRSTYK